MLCPKKVNLLDKMLQTKIWSQKGNNSKNTDKTYGSCALLTLQLIDDFKLLAFIPLE